MILEPILVFLLILHLRKTLRIFSPNAEWSKLLKISLYAVVALFILQRVLSIAPVTIWIWHLLLVIIVVATFKLPQFIHAQPVMFAVLPFIGLSIIQDIIKSL